MSWNNSAVPKFSLAINNSIENTNLDLKCNCKYIVDGHGLWPRLNPTGLSSFSMPNPAFPVNIVGKAKPNNKQMAYIRQEYYICDW